MYANCRAFVVHRTPTRLRIKIPEWRHQDANFAELRRTLVNDPDVLEVDVNPVAASMVVRCRPCFDMRTVASWFPWVELQATEQPVPDREPVGAESQGRSGPVSADQIGLALLLVKLLAGVATNQIGAQLIAWIVDAFMHAARQQPARFAAR